jgi:hypothetical protein
VFAVMSQVNIAGVPISAGPSRLGRPAPRFGFAIVQLRQRLMKGLIDPYRPELHYMRGPGPKWREKHCQASVSSNTSLEVTRSLVTRDGGSDFCLRH